MLNGPGLKYWVGGVVEPLRVPQAGLTYSHRLPKPSPSGSPLGPSMLEFEVGSRPLATSHPSGIPSPSVSQPSGSSSMAPSPSSSSLLQSASPSPSLSKVSTNPSLSLSIPSLQMLPIGSSSAPSEPVPWIICMALSSSQFLVGTVPFHHTPLSSTEGVEDESHPTGIPYWYSLRLVKPSPSGSPVEPFSPVDESGFKPCCHSHPSGSPSLSESQS